jgi:hypothetical protein
MKNFTYVKGKFVFNPSPNPHGSLPSITLSRAPDGSTWATSEVSLPKMLFGTNSMMVAQHDIDRALTGWSLFVSEILDIEFDAGGAPVARVDYCYNFAVKAAAPYLEAVSHAVLPRLQKWQFEGTRYFGSRRRTPKGSRSRLIRCYAKPLPPNAQSSAGEYFRLESSFCKSRSCKRLAEKFGCKNRGAANLLTEQIAESVINSDLEALGLTQPVTSPDGRIDRLRERYGDSQLCRSALAFINYLDRYGREAVRGGLGYSRPSFYRHAKLLRDAGVQLSAEVTEPLPPLGLVLVGHHVA